MIGVELVRSVCKEKKIPIARLERELGFSNGYLNMKLKKIPYDRAVQIAKYLNIDVNLILGVEPEPTPEIPEGKQIYYLDPETAELAQELLDNPGRRTLMDASRNMTPDQLKALVNMIDTMSGTERGDYDEPC